LLRGRGVRAKDGRVVLGVEVMDEARRQGDFKLPEKIETTDYPVDLGSLLAAPKGPIRIRYQKIQ